MTHVEGSSGEGKCMYSCYSVPSNDFSELTSFFKMQLEVLVVDEPTSSARHEKAKWDRDSSSLHIQCKDLTFYDK